MKTHLSKVAMRTEKELQFFFSKKKKRAHTIDRRLVSMIEVLEEYMLRGGKRIRPFLCWLAYTLAGGTSSAIYQVCAAIEVLHFYILNLDDMADRDELRHGGPSLEVYYRSIFSRFSPNTSTHFGRSFSEIAGALLNSYAYELLRTAKFPQEKILQALGIFTTTMFEDTSAGWQIHFFQNLESMKKASIQEYVKGLNLVTAQYTFVGPLLIGLACAGKNKKLENIFRTYGMHTGTAFQIQDDILGVFGDQKHTGKPVGNDIREGKKTLLIQWAYTHANAEQKAFLAKTVGNTLSNSDLEKIRNILEETGALSYAKAQAQIKADKGIQALTILKQAPETTEYVQLLEELTQFLLIRNH